MARVVVDVMLKPEILDPQGRAVQGALGRLGLTEVTSVRQGKRFELEIDADIDEDLSAKLTELAGSLLSNPVIEDYEIYEEVGDLDEASDEGCACGECVCGAHESESEASDEGGHEHEGHAAEEHEHEHRHHGGGHHGHGHHHGHGPGAHEHGAGGCACQHAEAEA